MSARLRLLFLLGVVALTSAPAFADAPAPEPAPPAVEPPVVEPAPISPAPVVAPTPPPPMPPAPTELAPIPEAAPEVAADASAEIQVTSRTPLTTRDAPGIVSVIDRDEIATSGARDLMDLLQLVPGFSFGVDVSGVVGVSFRGEWGHEGKVLFLLDGHELNETLYSTMQLGMHIPASIIQRLEVIRGPGSAIYGGYAELAVVNIVTRSPKELSGVAASAYYGQMENGWGRVMVSASGGAEIKRVPGLALKLDLAYLDGLRSDRTYFDELGGQYSMRDGSRMRTFLLNFALAYKGLHLRFLFDDHVMQTQDSSGQALPAPVDQRFRTYSVDVRYDAPLGSKVTLLPHFSFKDQTPWQTLDKTSSQFYDKSAMRMVGGLGVSVDPIRAVNVLVGVEGRWDRGLLNDPELVGYQTQFGTSNHVDYGNLAAYGQVFWRNKIANVTAGVRYEYNNAYGHSVVPRVGFTKIVGRFNFKLLYSLAFRGPAIENLNLNPDLHPERTHVVEAEAGVQLSGHWAFVVNGYFMRITDAIVYASDPVDNVERYLNGGDTGTAGLEAQLKAKYNWMYATLAYSFYSSRGQNDVALYAVPGRDDVLIGTPAHKATLSTGFNVWRDHVTIGLTAVYLSPRYRVAPDDPTGSTHEPSTFLLGGNVAYRNLGTHGLDLMAGVQNALGQEYRLLQPYNAGHAPYPMASREVFVRLAYAMR